MINEKKLVPILRFRDFEDSSGWIKIKLSDLTKSFQYGLNASAKKYDGVNKYLRITDIDDESRRMLTNNLTSPSINLHNSESFILQEGDILFARTGASVGKSYIYNPRDGKVYYAGYLIRARIKPEFNYKFVFYNTLTTNYFNFIKLTSQRSGQPGVNANEYANYEFYIPSLKEQNKIGCFLKKIDEMIQLQQSKVNKIKDLKSAYLSEMFPKEGEKYPKKRFEGFTKPWKLTKFNEIADIERGLTYHPSDIVEKGGVRVLRSSNIDEDTFITKDDDVFVNENAINIEFSQKQNILITSANGSPHLVGKHAILEQLETPSVHGGFMLLARTASPYFLNASMSSDWYRKFIRYHVAGGGGSIGNIKKSDLEHQLIYIPSKEEQEKIGQFFKNLDNQISIEEEKLAKLEKLKQAYLNDMFV